MTIFDLKCYLTSQGFSDVYILNIGESRAIESSDYISGDGRFNYIWKLLTYSMAGYILHIETNGHNFKSWLSALICSIAGILNGRKTILALGSGNVPEYIDSVPLWKKVVIGITLKLTGIIICRNKAMVDGVEAFGIKPSRIQVVPGFVGVEGRSIIPAPANIQTFCENHAPIVGATVLMSPEYGIPLLCESIRYLQNVFPKIGLILMGMVEKEADGLTAVNGLGEHVMFAGQLSPGSVLDVMKKLTVFVRPTYFDGDSVSVREALSLGIPVVASATPGRPEGVIQFQIGNCADLCQKLEEILNLKDVLTVPKMSYGSGQTLLQLYLRLAN